MKGPEAGKAPAFRITSKSGRSTEVLGVKMHSLEECIQKASSVQGVSSRTALYSELLCNVIQQHPGELRSKPERKPENAAHTILTDLETKVFGKGEKTDNIYRVLKSTYLAYHRMGQEVTVERNGDLYAKPYNYVAAWVKEQKPAPSPDGEKFIKAVRKFCESGLLEGSAPGTREVVEDAMQMLGEWRETLLKIEQGEIPKDFKLSFGEPGEGEAPESAEVVEELKRTK